MFGFIRAPMLDGAEQMRIKETGGKITCPESVLRTQNICSEKIKENMRKHTPVFEILHIRRLQELLLIC
jgi:hypothetical protein